MAKNIKQMAEEYALSQVLSCTDTKMTQQAYLSIKMFNGYDVACGYKDGANAVLGEINNKVNRSFLEDFEGMDEHDREIAQGAIAMVNIWIQQLKGE